MHHSASSSIFWGLYILLLVPSILLTYSGLWKMFRKAGKPGWGSIVPLYNTYCIFDIAWGNGWKALLMLIPLVNMVVRIITCVKLAAAFGKSGWYALGLLFFPPVFVIILGWGSARYQGPQ